MPLENSYLIILAVVVVDLLGHGLLDKIHVQVVDFDPVLLQRGVEDRPLEFLDLHIVAIQVGLGQVEARLGSEHRV